MLKRLNPKWCMTTGALIRDFKMGISKKYEVVTSFNLAKQYVIETLNTQEIPFRVLPLGAGVTKITTETDICPKCKGTGRI
jgi:hypothetical protein